MAGHTGGAAGGAVGAFTGLWTGGRLGWHAGKTAGLHLAKRTGEGKVNPIVGGIGSLTVPLMGSGLFGIGGAVAMVAAAGAGNPWAGAAIAGISNAAAELVRSY
ncbi:MAG: hypothetical protein HY319_29005 [Armatimonadetes bacterium]|nr:hypothetical protein [Armatimonadota bacterium]